MDAGRSAGTRPATLSPAFVKTVARAGRYGDGRGGHGLSLLVKPMASGRLSKTWSQRVRIGGRPANIGLGRYPIVSLAEARAAARGNARALAQGRDVRGGGVPTFAEAVRQVIEVPGATRRDGGRLASQCRSSLRDHVLPRLGRKRVSDVTTADVMAVLLPIWNEKRETARRVRQRIGAVMTWAVAQGYRGDNPAGEAVGAALPRVNGVQRPMRALPHAQVAAVLERIRQARVWPATRLAFEFLVLTAARSGDVRHATWNEIEFGGAVWTVPAERTRAKREHRVPLSAWALDLLREARKYDDDSGLVFPSQTGRVLSDNTISKLLREQAIAAVPHGFRSSFRDWCSDTGQPRELAEMALARVVRGVEGAYTRSDLFERRRRLMDRWAAYLTTVSARVVRLNPRIRSAPGG